ncbi:H-NS family nucleoid-associated regulatory protein [Burkholderia cepacia]|uniref:H-NS histone family protein n=1 Tax=Burkholderia cepacia TaxID=292 RepID=UPI0009C0E34E|nr:H-NS histone family protein [Burkholderia cepacia]
MTTYLELKTQAEALARQVEQARLAELDGIITAIRDQIDEYGITADQLFGRRRPVAPKYRNPSTGAIWSGRGRPPHWIVGAKNRDRFLIEN